MGSRAILDEYSKSGPPPGFNSQTTQPVVSHYTDCAIPAVHHLFRELGKKVCNSVTGDVFLILSLIRFIKMFLHVIYSEVWTCKHFHDTFPVKNGLKGGDALLLLLFRFVLEYAVMKAQANQVGLKLDGTCQLSACTDDDNLLGRNIYTIKKKLHGLIVASKEVCLEVNAEKTEYMFLPYEQNAGGNHNVDMANKSLKM